MRRLGVMVGIWLAGTAWAQDVTAPEKLNENVHEAAQSSGAVIRGAQLAGPVRPAASGSRAGRRIRFAVHVPEGWGEGAFCMLTQSADGLYDGEGTYTFTPGTAGVADTYYPSDHVQRVRGYGAAELAVQVRRGACGRLPRDIGTGPDKPLILTLAFWRTEAGFSPDAAVALLVNPMQASAVRVNPPEGDPVDCTPAPVPVPTSYGLLCTLPRASLGPSPAHLELQTRDALTGEVASSWVELHFPDQDD